MGFFGVLTMHVGWCTHEVITFHNHHHLLVLRSIFLSRKIEG